MFFFSFLTIFCVQGSVFMVGIGFSLRTIAKVQGRRSALAAAALKRASLRRSIPDYSASALEGNTVQRASVSGSSFKSRSSNQRK